MTMVTILAILTVLLQIGGFKLPFVAVGAVNVLLAFVSILQIPSATLQRKYIDISDIYIR